MEPRKVELTKNKELLVRKTTGIVCGTLALAATFFRNAGAFDWHYGSDTPHHGHALIKRFHVFQMALSTLAAVLALAVLIPSPYGQLHARPDDNDHRALTVMTRNLYQGADFTLVAQVPTPANIEATFAKVVQTDFPARAEALADEIDEIRPALIGLQEVSLVRTQTPGDFLLGHFAPNAEDVVYDFLDILLDALDARGLSYASAVVLTVFDAELPGAGRDVRLTDREVVLVRTDLPLSELEILGVDSGHYLNHVEITFPFVGNVAFARGWVAVDARIKGKKFRFLSTHLEPAASNAAVQEAQAEELINGPADTNLPLIFVGDFNSSADPHPVLGTATYGLMLDAGFVEAWDAVHPDLPGYTVGQSELLDNEVSLADARIDFVFVRDGFDRKRKNQADIDVLGARRTGDVPLHITDTVRWASDHFGMSALLRLEAVMERM